MPDITHLVAGWRKEAERLRALEANGQAAALEIAARELESVIAQADAELLTIAEASEVSGYSRDRLRELAHTGQLPSERGVGKKSHYRIPRGSLPQKKRKDGRKPGLAIDYDASEDARNIAMQLGR
jgi:excisionase family DNA binding protein